MLLRDPRTDRRASVRVGIVEDHPVIVAALTGLLDTHQGIDVVGAAGSIQEFYDTAHDWNASLLLLDIDLPDGSGLDLAEQLMEDNPSLGIVFYSGTKDRTTIRRALDLGCRGYLSKLVPETQIVSMLMDAASGQRVFDSQTASIALSDPDDRADIRLTPREAEVLQLVAADMTNERIARELGIAANTVKTLISRVRAKLNVSSRAAAVAVGISHGLIQPTEASPV